MNFESSRTNYVFENGNIRPQENIIKLPEIFSCDIFNYKVPENAEIIKFIHDKKCKLKFVKNASRPTFGEAKSDFYGINTKKMADFYLDQEFLNKYEQPSEICLNRISGKSGKSDKLFNGYCVKYGITDVEKTVSGQLLKIIEKMEEEAKILMSLEKTLNGNLLIAIEKRNKRAIQVQSDMVPEINTTVDGLILKMHNIKKNEDATKEMVERVNRVRSRPSYTDFKDAGRVSKAPNLVVLIEGQCLGSSADSKLFSIFT